MCYTSPMTESASISTEHGSTTTPRHLSENVGWLMARVSHALASALSKALVPLELSLRGYLVLSAAQRDVLEGKPHTQLTLARELGLDKSIMVLSLDELEGKGFVIRRPDPRDRRARNIEPTKAGRKVLARAQKAVREAEREALTDLSEEEQRTLLTLLNRLVSGRLSESIDSGSCLPRSG